MSVPSSLPVCASSLSSFSSLSLSNSLTSHAAPSEDTHSNASVASTSTLPRTASESDSLSTPVSPSPLSPLPSSEVYQSLVSAYQTILANIPGLDPTRSGVSATPERAARALQFLTSGYQLDVSSAVGAGVFDEDCSEMVLVRDVALFSLCEHHMLPFTGIIHMAYIPNGRVLGLSKLVRLAEVFARRLQVQERLTKEIAQAIEDAIQPKGVAVFIDANHMCMTMRGVQKPGSSTITTAMRGCFQTDPAVRAEFFTSINYKK